VALDMGSGALGALQRYCDPRDLDAVALSHLHPDHCADLAALHVYLAHHPDGESACTVFGPFGTSGRINELRGSSDQSAALDAIAWQSGGSVAIGPMRITCESVAHPIPAYALRVEGPSEREARSSVVLAYSGDTDECDGIDVVAAGADVFLCEATYLERFAAERGTHLTGAAAGGIADRAGVDRLVLTHIPPWTDPNEVLAEAGASFSGALELACPGQHLVL
jgi:ribonuclease BN (tRNA processing enzyme)